MKCRSLFFAFSSLFFLAFSNELLAQTTTSGGLAGVVSDPSGAVVPDAYVEIRDNSKGTTQATKTDREGVYRFFFLAPSRYTLTVTHDGFQKVSRTVEVLLGPPGSVNVTLELMKASTTVRVAGEAPLLNTENGDVSTTMNQQQISEVPNPGNDLTYIAQTAPGAIMNTEGGFGNFSILGMPGTSNLFTVNGMYDNDEGANLNLTGATNMTLGQNQIQEGTVVSNGYSGQFWGYAGANINYITKSGGNSFHGNAVYYWNGRAFNANDWLNNAQGTPRPFVSANQWAGSFGGPIKMDKLFFFFDTEGMRVFIPAPAQVTLPSPQFEAATIAHIDSIFGPTSASTAFYRKIFSLYNATPGASSATSGGFSPTDPTGCNGFTLLGPDVPCAVHFQETIGQPAYASIVSGRVDWNIRSNDRAFLFLQYDRARAAAWTDPISPLFNATNYNPFWRGQLSETHIFGTASANQFLLAAWYPAGTTSLANPSKAFSAFPTTLSFFIAGNAFSQLGGQDNSYLTPPYGHTLRYQIDDDFVKTRGEHKLGFGAIFVHTNEFDSLYAGNAIGTLAPQTLKAFYFGGVDPSSPTTDFTNLFQSFPKETTQRPSYYKLGFYAQDEWQVRANLALTFALRSDHPSDTACERRCYLKLPGPFESINHDPAQPYNQALLINQKQAYQNADSLQWAPRFSFAWQPLGVSRNLVVRGGIGIFYDPLPFGIAFNLPNNPPLINSFTVFGSSLAPDETNSLFKNAAASNATLVNGFAAGQTLAQIQKADPFFFPPSITIVGNNKLHSPQYQKWSLQLQQTFGANTSLSVGYSGFHGIHILVQNPSANAFGFGPFPAQVCSSPPVPPCADPRFSQVTEVTTQGISNYNGMVVSLEQRFNRWGQGFFQVNYTYGHALDEASNGGWVPFTFGSSLFPQDPNNLRGSYGSADNDARHSLNANYVWEVPVKAMLHGHGTDYLTSGWQISGTIFAHTAFPYTVFDFAESGNLNRNNFFGFIYAVPAGPLGAPASCGKGAAIPAAPRPCQPPQVLADGTPNPNALFVQSTCETGFNTGTLPGPNGPCSGPAVSFAQGRNRFRGSHYFNTNFAILKNSKIPRWENAVLGIGFQFFNLFNHPNFTLPDNGSSDGTFGQITNTSQPPTGILGAGLGGNASARMIQLKVQLKF